MAVGAGTASARPGHRGHGSHKGGIDTILTITVDDGGRCFG
jgi:hypothetical protein